MAGVPESEDLTREELETKLVELAETVRGFYDPREGFPSLGWEGGRRFAYAAVAKWREAGQPVPRSWTQAQELAWRQELERVRLLSLEEFAADREVDPDAGPFPELPEGSPYHAIVISWLAAGCLTPVTTEQVRAIVERIPERTLIAAMRWQRLQRQSQPRAALTRPIIRPRSRRAQSRSRRTRRARAPASSRSDDDPDLARARLAMKGARWAT